MSVNDRGLMQWIDLKNITVLSQIILDQILNSYAGNWNISINDFKRSPIRFYKKVATAKCFIYLQKTDIVNIIAYLILLIYLADAT